MYENIFNLLEMLINLILNLEFFFFKKLGILLFEFLEFSSSFSGNFSFNIKNCIVE